METILDSVEIPGEYVDLCSRWYDGSSSMMYAVASTGNLSRGSIRPTEHEGHWETPTKYVSTWRDLTDLEWYRSLFSDLSSEVMWSIEAAEKSHDPDVFGDLDELRGFDAWIDGVLARLDAEIESEAARAHN